MLTIGIGLKCMFIAQLFMATSNFNSLGSKEGWKKGQKRAGKKMNIFLGYYQDVTHVSTSIFKAFLKLLFLVL